MNCEWGRFPFRMDVIEHFDGNSREYISKLICYMKLAKWDWSVKGTKNKCEMNVNNKSSFQRLRQCVIFWKLLYFESYKWINQKVYSLEIKLELYFKCLQKKICFLICKFLFLRLFPQLPGKNVTFKTYFIKINEYCSREKSPKNISN